MYDGEPASRSVNARKDGQLDEFIVEADIFLHGACAHGW